MCGHCNDQVGEFPLVIDTVRNGTFTLTLCEACNWYYQMEVSEQEQMFLQLNRRMEEA